MHQPVVVNKSKKIELLAPAGSLESFHAAIQAGADAVYVGIDKFNARLRAKNFTLKTLSYCVPFAHSKKVKVYVTLNTLLKQTEIKTVIDVLYQLQQLSVDAVIVADVGLMKIAKTYFPSLVLHGSTQLGVHNQLGIEQCKRLGLKRIVLARELSYKEIEFLQQKSPIELEVFIHGALCYCISGMCLGSSFLGGASGNRGCCTQVCRRKFTSQKDSGYFFSPFDLCGIDYIQDFQRIGISSLKIEGRMKGPEYVYTVVNAYRNLLDHKKNLDQIKAQLTANDLARKKSTFFLNNFDEQVIDSNNSPGIGLLIGNIIALTENSITLKTNFAFSKGDRIRIQPKSGFEGVGITIDQIEQQGELIELKFAQAISCEKEDQVYLISRKDIRQTLIMPNISNVNPVRFREHFPGSNKILSQINPPNQVSGSRRTQLWFKIDNPDWLPLLEQAPCQKVIGYFESNTLKGVLQNKGTNLRNWVSRLSIGVSPFISPSKVSELKKDIELCQKSGINSFTCSNIGHRAFFSSKIELIADNPFWILNKSAQILTREWGMSYFFYSLEDDILNIKTAPSLNGIMTLYAKIPLFISRIKPGISEGIELTDPHENEFTIFKRNNLYYLIANKPFCITHKRKKLEEIGIHTFAIDLSFHIPDKQLLLSIIDSYKTQTRILPSSLFNFKAELK